MMNSSEDPDYGNQDDMKDILQLMDRVKSKREKLKQIGQKESKNTSRRKKVNATVNLHAMDDRPTGILGSAKKLAFRSSPQHDILRQTPPKTERKPSKIDSKTRAIRKIFDDVMSPVEVESGSGTTKRRAYKDAASPSKTAETLRGDDESINLEDGEFVDEVLDDDENSGKLEVGRQNAKRVRRTRLISVAVVVVIIVVLIFALGARKSGKKSNSNPLPPIQAPPQPPVATPTLAPSVPPATPVEILPTASPVFLQPTEPPIPDNETSLAPTIPQVWTPKCFENRTELVNAVLDYLINPTPSTDVARVYGWPIGEWCVSQLTEFDKVFSMRYGGHVGEFNEDIGNWDVSNAKSMSEMFHGAESFNMDLSKWDVSKVKDFSHMFKDAKEFNQDLSTWDIGNAWSTRQMFQGAHSFEGKGLAGWNTAKVSDMTEMFEDAWVFNEDIGEWNVTSVTRMVHLFARAKLFNHNLDLWEFPKAKEVRGVFDGATNFNGRVSTWKWSREAPSLEGMFANAPNFNQDISQWDVTGVMYYHSMFDGASSFNQDLGSWNMAGAKAMSSMFKNAHSFFGHGLENWDTGWVHDMESMFRNATSFNGDVTPWTVSRVTNMGFTFALAENFDRDLSSWNVEQVTSMAGMFRNAKFFNGDISEWDVSNVESMDLMFMGAESFNQDLSSWNVSKVSEMGGMFVEASSFRQDLCAWGDRLQPVWEEPGAHQGGNGEVVEEDHLFTSKHYALNPDIPLFMHSQCPDTSTPQFFNASYGPSLCFQCV